MTNRWEPFDHLTGMRDTMGRLFDQHSPFGGRGEAGEGPQAGVQSMPVNIFEAEDLFMIIVPMPGLQEEDIDISVLGNSLTVEGRERADLKPESGKRYIRHEWRYGPYRRVVELPAVVEADSAEATLGNGVLTVRLQKAEVERAHRVQVRSGVDAGTGQGERRQGGQGGSNGRGEQH